MASPCSKSIFVFFLCCAVIIISATAAEEEEEPIPIPTPWPHQFHSIFFMNASDKLQIIDLWYDWPSGRNLNIIQDQLGGPPLYSLEWNNGTSFFYTLADPLHCFSAQFDVGILRPDWIVTGANYLGQRLQDGFLCNVWEKADYFITYYEDVLTRRPVFWVLFSGALLFLFYSPISFDLFSFDDSVPLRHLRERLGRSFHVCMNIFKKLPLIYDELCPLLWNQFKSRVSEKFETFDAALDELYSKIESQRSEQQKKAKEGSAMQKLSKIRLDQFCVHSENG